jgi:hypothetical protein
MAAGKNELKQRASRAIVLHAFFRLESALVIAMTLILIAFLPRPFPWWQWWYWLVFGLVSEALVLYTSITDERTNRRLVENLLRQEFNPSEISSAEYRQRVEKALEYRQQIEEHVSGIRAGVLRGHLLETTAGVADWVESVFGLAKRLDRYHSDRTLVRDRREVPREIVGLRARLDREDDEAVFTAAADQCQRHRFGAGTAVASRHRGSNCSSAVCAEHPRRGVQLADLGLQGAFR